MSPREVASIVMLWALFSVAFALFRGAPLDRALSVMLGFTLLSACFVYTYRKASGPAFNIGMLIASCASLPFVAGNVAADGTAHPLRSDLGLFLWMLSLMTPVAYLIGRYHRAMFLRKHSIQVADSPLFDADLDRSTAPASRA